MSKGKIAYAPSILDSTRDWQLAVDLLGYDKYPESIWKTGLRTDIVLHSASTGQLILIELTVPYESWMEDSNLYKLEKYSELVAGLRRDGAYKVSIFAVEVGATGLVSTSTYNVLKRLGLRGNGPKRSLKLLAEAAERASSWLWTQRRLENHDWL